MPALLLWLGRYLLGTVASEVFKRAAIFLTLNIVLSFMISIFEQNDYGFNIFGIGAQVGNLVTLMSTLGGGIILYVMEGTGCLAAIFLILNAYLARFAYRMIFRSLGR
jgi:hypothetical protein